MVKQMSRTILMLTFWFCYLGYFHSWSIAQNSEIKSYNIITIDTSGYNYYPSLSPKGRYIAYVKMFELDYRTYGNIWLYDSLTDTSQQLTTNTYHAKSKDNYLSWSSDESKLYFSAGGNLIEYDIDKFSANVILETDLESENKTAFAPTYSTANESVGYWIKDYNSDSHHLCYLDLKTNKNFTLPELKFNPGTEVAFYNPQWSTDGERIFGTYFNPKDRINLYVIDITQNDSIRIESKLRSTYFIIQGDKVYYTKTNLDNQNPRDEAAVDLFSTNLDGSKKRKVFENMSSVFDVDDSGRIYFSRNDTLYVKKDSEVESLFPGSNPKIQGDLLIFERWKEINKEPGFENHLFWIEIADL